MEYSEYLLELDVDQYVEYCDLLIQIVSSFFQLEKSNKDKIFVTNLCLDLTEKKANNDDISNARSICLCICCMV